MSASRSITTIAWGLFLACSWTWCIAMYLPVILLKRHGAAGFIVFAAANVLGCAAFGYVLTGRAASQAVASRHAVAMTWFSIVTIAYHAFFAVFLITELMPYSSMGYSQLFDPSIGPGLSAMALRSGIALALLLGAGWVLSLLNDRLWLILAAVTSAISLTALIVFSTQRNLLHEVGLIRSTPALAWLAPTIIFGFLLCPYLDLTFHRALQHSPSRHSFTVFGLTFLFMLVLTCFLWFRDMPVLGWLAMLHLAGQSIFTVGAHLRELRPRLRVRMHPIAAYLLMFGLPLAAGAAFFQLKAVAGDERIGDSMYLRFLIFYGLIFPAYVLLFIGPWRPKERSRRTMLAFAALMLASMPAYEFGFLHDRPWLLVIPLVLLLLWSALTPNHRVRGQAAISATKL